MIEKCEVRKFIFSEVLYFLPATLLKNEPIHRIISNILPTFWMAAFELLWTEPNSYNELLLQVPLVRKQPV